MTGELKDSMRRRLVLVTILLTSFVSLQFIYQAVAQTPDEETLPAPIIESPPPTPELEEQPPPEFAQLEQKDAVISLSELRSTVRTSPDNAHAHLKLAQGLYRIGDLDAAIDECRVAIRLNQDNAKAHLQLGVILMVKQNWRAAASVLKEAIRLDPALAHAHYSLGSVLYSLGKTQAAIQSYREALEWQSYFPDARYRLALLLKLAHQEQEAAQLMEEAAMGGVPQAQFFLGNAYKNGQGVEKDLALAIFWWAKAVELGHQPAADALSKLRRQALSPKQSNRQRTEAFDAFRAYRYKLWDEFPDYPRTDDGETLGTTLLMHNRADYALSILLKEGYALDEISLGELAHLYRSGWEPHLAPFDKKILTCLETTAAEGFVPAKKILARIYGKGLGMEPDMKKARAILKGLSKREVKSLLDELSAP
jgi:TPR repeat protein